MILSSHAKLQTVLTLKYIFSHPTPPPPNGTYFKKKTFLAQVGLKKTRNKKSFLNCTIGYSQFFEGLLLSVTIICEHDVCDQQFGR